MGNKHSHTCWGISMSMTLESVDVIAIFIMFTYYIILTLLLLLFSLY